MTPTHLQTLIPGHRIIAIRDLYYIENNDGERVTEPESWADTVASALAINTRELRGCEERRKALLRSVAELSGNSGELTPQVGDKVEAGNDFGRVSYVSESYVSIGANPTHPANITHINGTPVRHIDGVRFAIREDV